MAGVKGRSGGARPGAGRKKKPPVTLAADPAPKVEPAALDGMGEAGFDPRPALEQTAQGLLEPSATQMKALIALLPYVHTKKGEGGKKDQVADKARRVAGGKFGASAPPLQLVRK